MTRHRDLPRLHGPKQVHTITGAQASHDDDLHQRMRKYLISMSIRTVCFVLAVVVSGPMRWAFVAGAFILPYFAVVVANAGPRRREGHVPYRREPEAIEDAHRRGLGE